MASFAMKNEFTDSYPEKKQGEFSTIKQCRTLYENLLALFNNRGLNDNN
jgi:hypothetical protein